MSFVDHAEEQDALAFGQELQERLREKVGVALEQRKVEVAQSLFGEEPINEDQWLQGAVHPSRAGMFDGVGVESMEKELSHLKATGPHPAGSHEATREHQLTFAIRAKKGHGFH